MIMTSLNRPLTGDALFFRLRDEESIASDAALLERNGRNARTLLKDGPLRLTMIVIAPGGGIPEHHTVGPITVQNLSGTLRLTVSGKEHILDAGDLVSIGAGVPHAVASTDGATFLLTVLQPEAGGTAEHR